MRRNCPYYDKGTVVYGYDDERLPELCGIRIKRVEEQAPACPLLSFELPAAPFQEGGSSSSAGSGAPMPPGSQVPPGILRVKRDGAEASAGREKSNARRVHWSGEEPASDEPHPVEPEEPASEEPSPEGSMEKASFDHLLTHKPADTAHCETCMRAKSRHVKKFVGSMKRDPHHSAT